ncbi:MAG: hypothetical protein K8R02_07785 [Anaerohalosphaeraceae bacterium]|nr:hypothetical protein [Anaerohalosphaeraceae bacterium]
MGSYTKTLAVLTEEGSLNIHAIDVNQIELTMEEEDTDDENDALDVLLSRLYNLDSIQWQVIEKINLKF